jgi:hypothetical protein
MILPPDHAQARPEPPSANRAPAVPFFPEAWYASATVHSTPDRPARLGRATAYLVCYAGSFRRIWFAGRGCASVALATGSDHKSAARQQTAPDPKARKSNGRRPHGKGCLLFQARGKRAYCRRLAPIVPTPAAVRQGLAHLPGVVPPVIGPRGVCRSAVTCTGHVTTPGPRQGADTLVATHGKDGSRPAGLVE